MNSKQITYLRGLGHHLNAVVSIGNHGLTEQVLKEIETALKAHELIKIKISGDDRALRIRMLEEICEKSGATAVHHIGKQLVIYRPSEKAKITLP
ncbi:RNA-binding protein [Methylophilaceae bacterium]|nr:RNA-binding protein [Methylophilaceae bacterium]